MRVGLLTASLGLWRGFFATNLPRLAAEGIDFPLLVLDEMRVARRALVRHKLARARVRARIEGCSVPAALGRSLAYALLTARRPRWLRRRRGSSPGPPGVPVVRVASANASAAAAAFRRAGCDLVCILNVRILTRRTLAAIEAPVVNVHLSDPAFVRGAQPVLWEVLAGREHILLTAHVVTEEVDAGGILEQRPQPILYRGGLVHTRKATLAAAESGIGDVLEAAIRRFRAGDVHPRRVRPGPLRAAPPVRELLRAEWLCRRRTGDARRRSG